ncbi:MAG: hypothetical protein GC202_04025 [Alphaproteobacteria bacterium]|nr:hypothetical protein [Alphaproteobacteria bacterium]
MPGFAGHDGFPVAVFPSGVLPGLDPGIHDQAEGVIGRCLADMNRLYSLYERKFPLPKNQQATQS